MSLLSIVKPGQPNYANLAQLGLGYLYSAISDTSVPNRRYFGSIIVPAPSTVTDLLATAVQFFEIITRFKGENLYMIFQDSRRLRLWKELASFYVYLQADLSLVPSVG
jgi:hypothetical protein